MISIIICSVNPVLFTRISAHYKELLGAEPHEIIGIHDARRQVGLSERGPRFGADAGTVVAGELAA